MRIRKNYRRVLNFVLDVSGAERKVAAKHLVQNYTDAPHVASAGVSSHVQNLRSHVAFRSNVRLQLSGASHRVTAEPEINYLWNPLVIDNDILWLEVSVDDMLIMNVI